MSHCPQTLLFLVLCLLTACSEQSSLSDSIDQWSASLAGKFDSGLQQAEQQIRQTQQELSHLARIPSEQTGEGLGYHSRVINNKTELWVQIDLQKTEPLDTLVLVPVVLPREQGGIAGYGFPSRFRVDLATDSTMQDTKTIADYSEQDLPNPGRNPVVIDCHQTPARYIRLTVITAGRQGTTLEHSLLALSEIMALRGDRNLAAGRPVHSSTSREAPPVWALQNLTDSQSILGPPEGSLLTRECGWHSHVFFEQNTTQTITLNWDQPHLFEDIRIFPMRWPGYPHWIGFGFPIRFKMEAFVDQDSTTPVLVFDRTLNDFPNPGLNPVVFPADGIRAQRLTLTLTKLWERFNDYASALAEIQTFSNGQNIAPQSQVNATSTYDTDTRRPWSHVNLIDGNTTAHPILPLKQWIEQLHRSTQLETSLTQWQNARARRLIAWHHGFLTAIIASITLLTLLAIWFSLRNSIRRRRELHQLRDRIASDLHDEVGSNLAGIALLGREGEKMATGELAELLIEIRHVADETSGSMRDLVWMIHPSSPGDLVGGLRQVSTRLLRGMDVHFHLPENPLPTGLSPAFKREIYLIFREALQNIAKHSQATRVDIHLSTQGHRLHLTVHDNGRGFSDASASSNGHGITNMRERANRLGGTCEIDQQEQKGCNVQMVVRLP